MIELSIGGIFPKPIMYRDLNLEKQNQKKTIKDF